MDTMDTPTSTSILEEESENLKKEEEEEETPKDELAEGVYELKIDENTVEVEERVSFQMSLDIPRQKKRVPLSDTTRNLIVHYCTAVQRIFEFKTHPQLLQLHKQVPLRIELLELSPNFIIIDAIKHTYTSVLLHLNGKPLPSIIVENNKNGSYKFDVNKFGAEVRDNWTPGDVTVRGKYQTPFQGYGKKESFDVFVRATSQYVGEKKKVQTMTEKISTLMKTVTEEMLGGDQEHVVLSLRVSIPGILRLPVGLKLRVKELASYAHGLDVLDTIPQIIHDDSLPLSIFSVFLKTPKDSVIQHPIFRSTKTLRLYLPKNCQEQNWPEVLKGFKNQNIKLLGFELHFKQYFGIVKDWLRSPRPLGSSFSTMMAKFDYAMTAMQQLLAGLECAIQFDRPGICYPTGLVIHINDDLELTFYPTVHGKGEHQRMALNMEVMPRGTNRLVYRVSAV